MPSFNDDDLYAAAPLPPNTRRNPSHVVAWVKWPKGVQPEQYADCMTGCRCGWEGRVGEWISHRNPATKDNLCPSRSGKDNRRCQGAVGHVGSHHAPGRTWKHGH